MAVLITGGARSGKSDFAERYAKRLSASGIYIATSQSRDTEMDERIRLHRRSRETGGFPWRTIEEPLELPALLRRLEREAGDESDAVGERPVVLVDCLTLWLTNVMLREEGERFEAGTEMDANTDKGADMDTNTEMDTEHSPESAAEPAPHSEAGRKAQTNDKPAGTDDMKRRSSSLADAVADLIAAVAEYGGPLLLVTNEVGSGIVPAYPLGRRFRDEAGRLNRRLAADAERAFLVVSGYPLDLKALAFRLEDE